MRRGNRARAAAAAKAKRGRGVDIIGADPRLVELMRGTEPRLPAYAQNLLDQAIRHHPGHVTMIMTPEYRASQRGVDQLKRFHVNFEPCIIDDPGPENLWEMRFPPMSMEQYRERFCAEIQSGRIGGGSSGWHD